jgi:diguanylate cyclase (GGDEF)-like protein
VEEELLDLLDDATLDMPLVAGLAGERRLTRDERRFIRAARRRRGHGLYSDILFTISHEYFDPEEARHLWKQILDHKKRLSQQLGRDAGVAVAALDFLTNVRREIDTASVIRSGKMARVAEVALLDGLTGLLVHSTFLRRLEEELRRAARYGESLALLLLDLDDFKDVNDRRGHQAGDRALEQVGAILGRTARETDVVGRYGGEEFGMVLPRTDPREAGEVAERLRQGIEGVFRDDLGLTASVGLAGYPEHGTDRRRLIDAADDALYRSKQDGKNRSTMYPHTAIVGRGDPH